MPEIPPAPSGGGAAVTAPVLTPEVETVPPAAPAAVSQFDTFLKFAGPIAGFGALSYGVGAAIVWLRYATTGFNADLALSVASRGQVIFLGFRWLTGWTLGVLLATAALSRLRRGVESHFPEAKRFRWVALFTVGVILVVSALFTWSAFTAAFDLAAVVVFLTWRGDSERLISHTLLFAALLGAVSAVGWQLEINLPYDKVRFELQGQSTPYDGIYFGESDGYFYIAPRANDRGPFSREINVYPASQLIDLRLVPKPQTLCTLVDRPSVVFVHELNDLWATIKQHLRRTGQPAPPVQIRRPTQTHPEGYCPPLP